jgi:hypothetical protein
MLLREASRALVPHTKAEQKVLYDAIIALKDKEVQIDGHEGYLEHESADKALQKLGSISRKRSAMCGATPGSTSVLRSAPR